MILGVISLVEGRGKLFKRSTMWFVHIIGAVLGGGTTALALWLFAAPLRVLLPVPTRAVLFFVICVAALMLDFRVIRNRIQRGQVPASWAWRYGAIRSFAMYGFLLGSGLLTFVPYALTYVVFTASSLFLHFPLVLAVGAAFCLGRTFLIGPFALKAEPASRLLYRSVRAHQVWPLVSRASVVGLTIAAILSIWSRALT